MKNNPFHVELSPELIQKAQKKIDIIFDEAATKKGIYELIDPKVKPEWYDEDRFKKSQEVNKLNYTAAINGSLVGLLAFLQLPVGLTPLLTTGKSKNLAKLFSRYFDTLSYIDEWYHYDPFDPKSKAYQSLAKVRSMHANALSIMDKKVSVYEFAKNILKQNDPDLDDLEIEKYIRHKNRVWISQLDMALTQWAFLACPVLEPTACGFHGCGKEQIEDLFYFWKVISYKLGIDPKYSICEEINFDLNYAICKLILEQEFIPHMENVAVPSGITMSEGIFKAFEDILIGSNCNVYLKYWYKVLNINSNKLNQTILESDKMELFELTKKNQLTETDRKEMIKNGFNDKYIVDYSQPFVEFKLNGIKERILYKLYLILVNHLLKYDWVKNFTRNVIRNAIAKTATIKKEKINEFEKDKRFEFNECPFANKVSKN